MDGPQVRRDELGGGVAEHHVLVGGVPVSRRDAVEHLTDADPRLRLALTASIRAADAEAVFLETPPLRRALLDRPWSFVLVDAPTLARMPVQGAPFAAHLGTNTDAVATFPNLGRDAVLVAPRERGDVPRDAHAHLAAFARAAPDEAMDALWRATGAALHDWLDATPDRTAWLSTSGLGVAWLHVRLDSRPKYYQHAPYRDPDA